MSFPKGFIDKISSLSDERTIWIVIALIMSGLVILAHSFFQNYLYMPPCEQCVYIRFSMLVIAFGAVLAAINPKKIILKIIGFTFGFYGAIIGIKYSIKLNSIHSAVQSQNPFGIKGCSLDPSFPFGLPLDKWAPSWFKPTGDCGFDNPILPYDVTLSWFKQQLVDFYSDGWYLIPYFKFINMAQACLMIYIAIIALLCVMLVCWSVAKFK